jgi:Tfp pilus assembly protein PilX
LYKKVIQPVCAAHNVNREAGQVAIITVAIFMILFSVLVVSFTRMMVASARQTANDELRATALAAAESGVEDAKRVLTYCYANPSASGCSDELSKRNETSCTQVLS